MFVFALYSVLLYCLSVKGKFVSIMFKYVYITPLFLKTVYFLYLGNEIVPGRTIVKDQLSYQDGKATKDTHRLYIYNVF